MFDAALADELKQINVTSNAVVSERDIRMLLKNNDCLNAYSFAVMYEQLLNQVEKDRYERALTRLMNQLCERFGFKPEEAVAFERSRYEASVKEVIAEEDDDDDVITMEQLRAAAAGELGADYISRVENAKLTRLFFVLDSLINESGWKNISNPDLFMALFCDGYFSKTSVSKALSGDLAEAVIHFGFDLRNALGVAHADSLHARAMDPSLAAWLVLRMLIERESFKDDPSNFPYFNNDQRIMWAREGGAFARNCVIGEDTREKLDALAKGILGTVGSVPRRLGAYCKLRENCSEEDAKRLGLTYDARKMLSGLADSLTRERMHAESLRSKIGDCPEADAYVDALNVWMDAAEQYACAYTELVEYTTGGQADAEGITKAFADTKLHAQEATRRLHECKSAFNFRGNSTRKELVAIQDEAGKILADAYLKTVRKVERAILPLEVMDCGALSLMATLDDGDFALSPDDVVAMYTRTDSDAGKPEKEGGHYTLEFVHFLLTVVIALGTPRKVVHPFDARLPIEEVPARIMVFDELQERKIPCDVVGFNSWNLAAVSLSAKVHAYKHFPGVLPYLYGIFKLDEAHTQDWIQSLKATWSFEMEPLAEYWHCKSGQMRIHNAREKASGFIVDFDQTMPIQVVRYVPGSDYLPARLHPHPSKPDQRLLVVGSTALSELATTGQCTLDFQPDGLHVVQRSKTSITIVERPESIVLLVPDISEKATVPCDGRTVIRFCPTKFAKNNDMFSSVLDYRIKDGVVQASPKESAEVLAGGGVVASVEIGAKAYKSFRVAIDTCAFVQL